MAYIDNTRRNMHSPVELTLCLTPKECRIILPAIKKAGEKAKLKYEKYYDIHCSGEASARQQDLMYTSEEKMKTLRNIQTVAEEIITLFERR